MTVIPVTHETVRAAAVVGHAPGDRPGAGPHRRRAHQLRALIETDRSSTSSERTASTLIEYARFHRYQRSPAGRRTPAPAPAPEVPIWMRWYPLVPRVLFVLTPRPGVSRRRPRGGPYQPPPHDPGRKAVPVAVDPAESYLS
ncbi:hypothetical protein GCM10010277_85250 [Streptomyces longisporoflavus]|uniref:hypothetical protein n=1 Tax=Streptomyces longisporoflavus TaxID=28044 RepID=UPI00167EA418|nr:hypothetical protein [Streptomyces longisporoflavus]GGV72396.1 hypothetical protein GCM10010277_85250 [Streptomyces longisporoflavus]